MPGQLFVLGGHRKFGAEEKIAHGVLVEDAVDRDSFSGAGEINPVIARTITIEFLSVAFDGAEPVGIEVIEVFGQDLKFREQIELKLFGKLRHFRGANFVEDNLEHRTVEKWTAGKMRLARAGSRRDESEKMIYER